MTPAYLSIAGSDCSAGAGLQADLKTGFALGCYPLTAVTCVVNEAPGKVAGLVAMEPAFVASQVSLCMQSFPIAAIKTGMLYSPEIVRAVAEELRDFKGPIVIDPVMIATAGDALMLQTAIAAYEESLFPRCTLLTPNLDELARLLGCGDIAEEETMAEAAHALAARYHCAVLAKGGHLAGETCTDILAMPNGETARWTRPRTTGVSTHGTGCTLSSALAAHLALGCPLRCAVELSLGYVARAIASSHRLGGQWALNHHAPKP